MIAIKKEKVMTCVIGITILSILLSNLTYANSAQSYWYGVDSFGAIQMESECPIEVKQEILTFDLEKFPSNSYFDTDSFLAYDGRVTAEYTFYNPADYEVHATLVFPFGMEPDYGVYDVETGEELHHLDIDKYDILVNGETVERNIRYTLYDRYQTFDVEAAKEMLNYQSEDTFFQKALKVYRYTFQYEGVDVENHSGATLGFDLPISEEYKVIFPECNAFHRQKDDVGRYGMSAYKGAGQVELYFLGKEMPEVKWKFYKTGGMDDGRELDGTIVLLEQEEMTLEGFVMSYYSEEHAITKEDFYAIGIAALKDGFSDKTGVTTVLPTYDAMAVSTMRWYEYELVLGPGETLVNTVTAPIYPSIDLSYKPAVFSYLYYLSPASTWAKFGTLELVLNTPFHVIKDSMGGFERTETGYKKTWEGLPEGECEFTLCISDDPTPPFQYDPTGRYRRMLPFLIIGIVVFIGLILFVRKKKRR